MYRHFFKRLLDLSLSLVALPFWLFILLIIAPVIYLQDRGPIFYNAKRLGKDGRTFTMYKFRTMKIDAPDIRNADGSTFNAEDDPRLTRIGKFLRQSSLDETPQLLNVILGDMSLIGPRPDLPEHLALYQGNETRKLEVRPGITGFSQAYFRNTLPWKQRIQNDIYYIDHISLGFDARIFLKTINSTLKRQNIYVVENPGESREAPKRGEEV
ncbi:MAG: sugar transferase [Syntrophomonadaceae bacterium]